MPFTLVKGTFRPAAGVPDGDSVRFELDDGRAQTAEYDERCNDKQEDAHRQHRHRTAASTANTATASSRMPVT